MSARTSPQPTTTTPWRRSRQTAGWDCSTKSRAGTVPRQLIIPCTQSMPRQVSNTTPGMPPAAPSTRARSVHHDPNRKARETSTCGLPPALAQQSRPTPSPCRSPRAHCEPDAAWDPVLWRPCHCESHGRRLRDRALDCLEETSIFGTSVAPLSPIWRASNISRAH